MNWGPCQNENEFNAWLRGAGEVTLVDELRTLLGTTYHRTVSGDMGRGGPDHVFYSEERRSLLVVECAAILTRRHVGKDIVYSVLTGPREAVVQRVFLWITIERPTSRIKALVEEIHRRVLVDTSRLHCHIATLVSVGPPLRLNVEVSYGQRAAKLLGASLLGESAGKETLLSHREAARALGVGYTTIFNIIRRWGVKITGNRVPASEIVRLVGRLELKASEDKGVDLSGKFVPSHSITSTMLLAWQVNALLGRKGSAVRRPAVKPRWLTLLGPTHYRCLFDREEVIRLSGRS
jgi:hypothetical protein